MSTDPYHAVALEVQSSLQSASTLRASYVRIRNMTAGVSGDLEELNWARSELKATLAALEADLGDLEESVKMVESTDARLFGLDDVEVQNRRKYVGHVRRELESMRAELHATPGSSTPRGAITPGAASPSFLMPNSPSPLPRGIAEPDPEDHQGEWAREEQQMLIQQQDTTLDSIAGTLSTLAQQAGLIGTEVVEHNEMLDDLESGVDHTDNKLDDAMKRMRKFIRQTEETKSGWCIVILIIILVILLMTVILV